MVGYGSDDGFSVWLTESGRTLPSGSPDSAVLRQRASEYLDGAYGVRFPGTPTGGVEQEREWPRTGASDRYGNSIDPDTVPDRVIRASYYAAWLEANNEGIFSRTYTPGTEKVLTEVKGIKWEVIGDAAGAKSFVPMSTVIDGMLAPLLTVDDLPGVVVV